VTAARAPIQVPALRARLLRPTLPELWLFLAIALPALAALIASLSTVDLAYQLRAGADILAGRGIPSVDTWTFTAAGRPWFDQQWLAQVFLATMYQATGWTGLALLRVVLVVAIQGFLLGAIRRRAPSMRPRTAALLALGAFIVMAPALALRPQLFGIVLFAGSLAALAGRRERPGWWWIVPLLALVWANYHGSFVLAPLLVGLALLEDLHDRWPGAGRTFAMLVATVLATFVTPFGPTVWLYARDLASNHEVTSRISEWQPPRLTDVPGALFWLSVVAAGLTVVILARRGRTVTWPAIVTLVVFAGLGAIAARGVAWWPGIAAVTIAGIACGASPEYASPEREPRRSLLNGLVAVALVVAAVALMPFWRPMDRFLEAPEGLLADEAPSSVTAALRQLAKPADRVWNPQIWGSWFELAVPAPTYALDSRVEIFPSEIWARAEVVAEAKPGWEEVLDDAGVTIVVTEGSGTSPLAQALRSAAGFGWRLEQDRSEGSIWVRVTR
jgi:hypothetical protein